MPRTMVATTAAALRLRESGGGATRDQGTRLVSRRMRQSHGPDGRCGIVAAWSRRALSAGLRAPAGGRAESRSWLVKAGQSAALRRVGVAAAVAHRLDVGASLASHVAQGDVALRRRALRAIGELGRRDLVELVARHASDDDDPQTRGEAAWSAVLLGHDASLDALRATAGAARDGGVRACTLAARRAARDDAAARMLADTLPAGAVLEAAMMLGDTVMVPWLIARMRDEAHARRAGRAFAEITGCALVAAGLAAAPEAQDLGAEEDEELPGDADPDEALPLPDADAVARWWAARPLTPGTRLLRGRPWDEAATARALREGDQSLRWRAALGVSPKSGRAEHAFWSA